jgi:hypothetical protein
MIKFSRSGVVEPCRETMHPPACETAKSATTISTVVQIDDHAVSHLQTIGNERSGKRG